MFSFSFCFCFLFFLRFLLSSYRQLISVDTFCNCHSWMSRVMSDVWVCVCVSTCSTLSGIYIWIDDYVSFSLLCFDYFSSHILLLMSTGNSKVLCVFCVPRLGNSTSCSYRILCIQFQNKPQLALTLLAALKFVYRQRKWKRLLIELWPTYWNTREIIIKATGENEILLSFSPKIR